MKNNNQTFGIFKVVVLALCLSVGIQYVTAQSWVAPTVTPPNGNTAAPLNVSTGGQTKSGGLTVGNGLSDSGLGLSVRYGKTGFGTINPVKKVQIDLNTTDASDRVGFMIRNTNVSSNSQARLQLSVANEATTGTSGTQLFHTSTGSGLANYEAGPLSFWTGSSAGSATERLTIAPAGTVTVAGQIKVSGGSPVAGEVLTTDANGLATWEPKSRIRFDKWVEAYCPNAGQVCRLTCSDGWIQTAGGTIETQTVTDSNFIRCTRVDDPATQFSNPAVTGYRVTGSGPSYGIYTPVTPTTLRESPSNPYQ